MTLPTMRVNAVWFDMIALKHKDKQQLLGAQLFCHTSSQKNLSSNSWKNQELGLDVTHHWLSSCSGFTPPVAQE